MKEKYRILREDQAFAFSLGPNLACLSPSCPPPPSSNAKSITVCLILPYLQLPWEKADTDVCVSENEGKQEVSLVTLLMQHWGISCSALSLSGGLE